MSPIGGLATRPARLPRGLRIVLLLAPALLVVVVLFGGGLVQALATESSVTNRSCPVASSPSTRSRALWADPAVRASIGITLRVAVLSTAAAAMLGVAAALLVRSLGHTRRGVRCVAAGDIATAARCRRAGDDPAARAGRGALAGGRRARAGRRPVRIPGADPGRVRLGDHRFLRVEGGPVRGGRGAGRPVVRGGRAGGRRPRARRERRPAAAARAGTGRGPPRWSPPRCWCSRSPSAPTRCRSCSAARSPRRCRWWPTSSSGPRTWPLVRSRWRSRWPPRCSSGPARRRNPSLSQRLRR